MRNIFDQYNEPENRLTHSLVSCLYEDRKLLNSFVNKFCPKFFKNTSLLKIDEQTLPGTKRIETTEDQRKGLPDAIIYNEDQCLIIESKGSSSLTRDQLLRHENTIKRRGFDKIKGISITVESISKINVENWNHLTWTQIYNWAYSETKRSIWSKKLLDYFNVWESKMVEKEYLKGSITEFSGIHFDEENEYSYLEGKRLLRLLANKIRKNKTLEKELGLNLSGKGRGGIKKHGSQWDILTFKTLRSGQGFTSQPHLTIGIEASHAGVSLSIPNAIKGQSRKNFNSLTWKKFEKIIFNIAKNYNDHFGNSEGFKPVITTVQRRYPSQSSPPIYDAAITFDIRTAFREFSSKLKPTQKQQKEWLKAIFELIKNKRSNIHYQVGANFFYNKQSFINNKNADKVFSKALLACKPLVKHLFK